MKNLNETKEVTNGFRVDACDNIYDEDGIFYCKWFVLTKEEKKIIKQNPASAR